MIINLDELNYKNSIDFNYDLVKDEDLDKRILDFKDMKACGRVYLNSNQDAILECQVKGNLVLADAISLEEVLYPIDINIEENIDELGENYESYEQKSENILDLKQILWQNIVLEVPISYTQTKSQSLKGDGWEFFREDNKQDEIDPRLKKLEDLLKGDD